MPEYTQCAVPSEKILAQGFEVDSLLNSLQHFLARDNNFPLTIVVLASFIALLLFGWIVFAVRLSQVNRRLSVLLQGGDGSSLEAALHSHIATVGQTTRRIEAVEQLVGVLQAQIPHCIQRVGLTRYDAFEDVGGEQSFSVSLLDAQGDGIVLTGVYNRMDMRVYAKSVREGKASHALSEEENRALRQAVSR